MKRWLISVVAVLGVLVLVGGFVLANIGRDGARHESESDRPESEALAQSGHSDPDAGAAVDEARIRAFQEATNEGTAGVPGPIEHVATAGWGQAAPFSKTQDEWEPAVAADPGAPNVYLLATRYSGPNACGTCPDVKIMLRRSTDGGDTFLPAQYLCACPDGKNQYDPEIDVAGDGTVYAAWLQAYTPGVSISKSTDGGVTWTPPVSVATPWSDKPVLVTAPNGSDVYVAFNGPTAGDAYVAQSHDGGASWTTTKVIDSNRYTFAGGGYATNDGLVAFAENDFNNSYSGNVRTFALVSTDGGDSWAWHQVDVGDKQPDCTSTDCYDGFYGSVPAIAGDGDGTLLFAYARANTRGGHQRVYVSTSTDDGAHWSTGVRVSADNTLGAFPAAVNTTGDTFRITFMDRRTGRWNTWSRESIDGGDTWGPVQRISNTTKGAPYLDKKGFGEAYGDYQEVTVTNTGKTFAAWGEGPSYLGPGGVWYNRTT
jgi:hypothetical protein